MSDAIKVAITGQRAEWCVNWATFLDSKADEEEAEAQYLLAKAAGHRTEAGNYRAYALLACHHCGKTPEDDGDHTCPCPYHDNDCPDHLVAKPSSSASQEDRP